MTSNKPYLIRALYEWIMDNNMTPYITINTTMPNVAVPQKYIKNGKIILNIAQQAVRDLRIGNDALECSARFGGDISHIYTPIGAITAIFAQETGRGMIFPEEKEETTETGQGEKELKPHLKLIK